MGLCPGFHPCFGPTGLCPLLRLKTGTLVPPSQGQLGCSRRSMIRKTDYVLMRSDNNKVFTSPGRCSEASLGNTTLFVIDLITFIQLALFPVPFLVSNFFCFLCRLFLTLSCFPLSVFFILVKYFKMLPKGFNTAVMAEFDDRRIPMVAKLRSWLSWDAVRSM